MPTLSWKLRHLRCRFFALREWVRLKMIQLVIVISKNNTADIHTKPVAFEVLYSMPLRNLWTLQKLKTSGKANKQRKRKRRGQKEEVTHNEIISLSNSESKLYETDKLVSMGRNGKLPIVSDQLILRCR